MNQIELAQDGIISDAMKSVAVSENVDPTFIRDGIANGKIVLSGGSKDRACQPIGIGHGLRTKINANIGVSSDSCDIELELEKAKLAEKAGADTLMDLSTFGGIRLIREKILKATTLPLGTVPIYEVVDEVTRNTGNFLKLDIDDILKVIEQQAKQGCGNIAIHCGLTRNIVHQLASHSRIIKVASRGGSIIAHWVLENQKENPFYEYFNDILDVAYKYDLVVSLGAGLRSGAVADGADDIHYQEIINLGKLVLHARKRKVQVKVEGPGHLSINNIGFFIKSIKRICEDAPVGVLGPIVTDIAPGYDHITHAIGLAVAVMEGADFTSAVYPSEHLGLPQLEDIYPGIMAARIAAHAGDIAKLGEKARNWDDEVSRARAMLDWEKQFSLSIDPDRARALYNRVASASKGCSMCGELCAYKKFPNA